MHQLKELNAQLVQILACGLCGIEWSSNVAGASGHLHGTAVGRPKMDPCLMLDSGSVSFQLNAPLVVIAVSLVH
jgi:hypothetical protein